MTAPSSDPKLTKAQLQMLRDSDCPPHDYTFVGRGQGKTADRLMELGYGFVRRTHRQTCFYLDEPGRERLRREDGAPAVISHREAREIALADPDLGNAWRRSAAKRFIDTGEITETFAKWGRCHSLSPAPLRDLAAYVSHYGERGPVLPGYVVAVTRPCANCAGEGGYERIAEDTGEPFPAKCDEPGCVDGAMRVSRQEVATLDEARIAAMRSIPERRWVAFESAWRDIVDDVLGGSASSATLPDGSSITVEKTEGWDAL